MDEDVLSKVNTLKEVLNTAEKKLKSGELTIDSANKVSIIVSAYLSELEKEVLN